MIRRPPRSTHSPHTTLFLSPDTHTHTHITCSCTTSSKLQQPDLENWFITAIYLHPACHTFTWSKHCMLVMWVADGHMHVAAFIPFSAQIFLQSSLWDKIWDERLPRYIATRLDWMCKVLVLLYFSKSYPRFMIQFELEQGPSVTLTMALWVKQRIIQLKLQVLELNILHGLGS